MTVAIIAGCLFGGVAYHLCRADERTMPVHASDDDFEESPNVYGEADGVADYSDKR